MSSVEASTFREKTSSTASVASVSHSSGHSTKSRGHKSRKVLSGQQSQVSVQKDTKAYDGAVFHSQEDIAELQRPKQDQFGHCGASVGLRRQPRRISIVQSLLLRWNAASVERGVLHILYYAT